MAQRTQAKRVHGGNWHRFSAYTVDGGILRPTPGALVELYDPWEADRAAASEEERPYKQLLRLVQQLHHHRGVRAMSRNQRQLLERWLRRNGLLGILPDETLQFTTAPYWSEWPLPEERPNGEPALGIRPVQRQVWRIASGWRISYHEVGAETPFDPGLVGQPVDDAALSSRLHRVETVYRTWPDGVLERGPLSGRFRRFFGVTGTRDAKVRVYAPFSRDEFWRDYGEPLPLFIDRIMTLARALDALQGWKPDGGFGDSKAMRAITQINEAAMTTSLAGHPMIDGRIELGWSSPSLLGDFAVMMLEDIAAGQHVLCCPVCGGLFLSAAHQAKFCSSTCRFTHHKREQRRRDAEEGGTS